MRKECCIKYFARRSSEELFAEYIKEKMEVGIDEFKKGEIDGIEAVNYSITNDRLFPSFVTGNYLYFNNDLNQCRDKTNYGQWVLIFQKNEAEAVWRKIASCVAAGFFHRAKLTQTIGSGLASPQCIFIETVCTGSYLEASYRYLIKDLHIDPAHVGGYQRGDRRSLEKTVRSNAPKYYIDFEDQEFRCFKNLLRKYYVQDCQSLFGRFRRSKMMNAIDHYDVVNMEQVRVYAKNNSGLFFKSRSQKIIEKMDSVPVNKWMSM